MTIRETGTNTFTNITSIVTMNDVVMPFVQTTVASITCIDSSLYKQLDIFIHRNDGNDTNEDIDVSFKNHLHVHIL